MASSTERFANLGEAEIQKLLEDKDSLNTKGSTKASRVIFEDYLKAKSLNFPQNSEELADVLKKIYGKWKINLTFTTVKLTFIARMLMNFKNINF
jgi:GrpB-like predicted nucleotidyltransferase (UPF0157 family)